VSPHSSDAVVDNGEYQDDTIKLNGVELAVDSPIRGGMVSEFSTGLKVGKATYDEREHAFWMVFDDFSAGFGFRQAEVREAGGTHWDNVGGVDLRRPRHITLPPLRTTVDPSVDPGTTGLFKSPSYSVFHTDLGPDAAGNIYVAILDSVYTLDSTRATLTRRHQQAGIRYESVMEGVTSAGIRFLLAIGRIGTGALEYSRSTDGVTWIDSSNLPATPNASVQLSAAIWWDGLVIAHGEGDAIIGSSDGIAWNVDSAGALDPHWHTGDVSVVFLGTAMAPWGASAVYFLSQGKLWILDWYVYNAVEVKDVGDGNGLTTGTVWNGSVFVTDGVNVWEYNPGNAQTVRRVGLFGKDGSPPSAHENSNSYHIQFFIPGSSDLLAVCRSLTSPRSWRLVVYNGVGWSWLGPEVASSQPYGGLVDFFPTSVSLTAVSHAIDIAALDDQSGTDFTLHTFELPTLGDIPIYGAGQAFENGPLSFETGWFGGGFIELEGILIRMSIDGYRLSADETVRVEYRLNNNEEASYEDLGTYTQNQQEIWFNPDHRGLAFRSVQFRISLDRGSTTDRTPILHALVLLFDKVPHIRTSWTVRIDLSRTVERAFVLEHEEPATVEGIWQFLKSLVNTPRLIKMEIPSLESGGVNVRITDLPATISEFRSAAGGRGFIELQLIETAGP